MSIQSEIDRIKENISTSYTAVEEKGGTAPEFQSSGNLPDAIRSISTGPGLPSGTETQVIGFNAAGGGRFPWRNQQDNRAPGADSDDQLLCPAKSYKQL